ncbi:MAG: PAS domain S-box-containing protein [Halopseudomonas sp.]|uniref:PAS domain S-box protein n=1 Tax=Halopseudomonas sp. TaxID=2901191 RepID=UPI0039E36FE3
MKAPDLPANETERLAALHALKVLDTPAEARFDRITRVVQRYFDVPIALVSLVDEGRQWFKSCVGLDVAETSREISFCGHAILNQDIMIVPDASEDPRFADNPLVTGNPNIRFYAGAPLRAPSGERVGTLCIIDVRRREFSAEDIATLRDLADCVEEEVARSALEESEQRARLAQTVLKSLIDNVADGIVTIDHRGLIEIFNPAAEDLFGYNGAEVIGHNVKMLMPEPYRSQQDSYLQNFFTLGTHKTIGIGREFIGQRRDGSTFPMDLTVSEMLINGKRRFTGIVRDITYRKELQLTQRLQQAILRSSDDAIISKTLDGIITSWNPGAERIFGYRADEAIGQSMGLVIPHEQINEESEILAKIAHDESVDHFETVRRRKDGSLIDVSITISPLIDEHGIVTGLTKIARDITARKQSERELQRSSQLVKAVVDTIADGIITMDNQGIVQSFNGAAEKMFGRTEAQTIGQPLTLLMPPRYRDAHSAGLARLRAGEARRVHGVVEVHGLRADGGEFPLELALTEMGAVGQMMFVGAIRDITERQRNMAILTEERRRLFDTLDGANVGTFEWDLQSDALSLDERSANYIGFGHAELMPARMKTWTNRIHPEDLEGMKRLLNEHLAHQSGHYAFDARVRHKDGHWVWLHCSSRVTSRTADGKPLLMSGTHQDVTAQKSSQAAVLAARAQAEAANEAKSIFLANMSHEIRSPLNAILGLAYLLEQANIDLNAQQMVRKIRSSGRMLLGLISDILDMSKIEAGQMILEQATFDLETVVDNVATALGMAIGDKDIEAVVSPLPEGVHSIMGDATRLQQVLINLVSNAAKFTHSGSIEVRIELPGRTDETDWLRFSVHDTGIGIAPEKQGGVFEAFTQADTSTTRRFGGTGLGLSISRQLVALMGSELGLNSVPGQGSEFWFTLPLKRVEAAQDALDSLAELELLIVDDSEVSLQALGAVAQQLGWRVNKLDSGASALALLLEHQGAKYPDVVLLDWKMPGMDGLAVMRAIRAGMSQSECPIVIMATAHDITKLASQTGAELADATLSKPVTASALKQAVLQAQLHCSAPQHSAPSVVGAASDLLAGVRVLVVDDSDINREVAQRILTGHAATVALAEDGQQALDWLLAHPLEVDLVLMDMQMPVLDGLEATRRLRRLPEFDDLPIVVLTAGAFESQRQEAMDAGMTAFASKPFDVPLTVDLIRRLRRPAKLQAAVAEGTCLDAVATSALATAPEASAPVGVMDAAQGLAIWSDLASYQTYLRRFAESYRDAAETMRTHLASSDRPGAAALAHKLSGVAANLALPDTRRAAQELGRVLGMQDDVESALVDLSRALAAVLAEINSYAPPVDQANAATGTAAVAAPLLSAPEQLALKKQLNQLLQALDSDDPARIKKEMTALAQQLPTGALAAIEVSVLGYDFRGAEAHTLQIAVDYTIDFEMKS